MIRLIALLVLLVSAMFAQSPVLSGYTANKSTTGTTEKITIQQPASGSRRVRLVSAFVYCSVGCDIDQSRNGTAATSTTLATSKLNPSDAGASSATAWSASNVGAGTTIAPTITISPGVNQPIDLQGLYLIGDGSGNNYTIAITAGTSGTIRVSVKWYEE